MSNTLTYKLAEEYWVNLLKTYKPKSMFPQLEKDTVLDENVVAYPLTQEVKERWNAATLNKPMNQWVLFQAAFALVYYRYTNHEDFLINSHSPKNTNQPFFTYIKLGKQTTVSDLVGGLKKQITESLSHPDFRTDVVLKKLGDPIFTEQMQHHHLGFNGVVDQQKKLSIAINASQITVTGIGLSEGLKKQLASHLERAIGFMLQNKTANISLFEPLTPDEHTLLTNLGINDLPFQQGQHVLQIFDNWVKKTPTQPALITPDQTWTYQQLDEESNQLANCIQSKTGLVTNSGLIAILAKPSAFAVISALGIMKSGHAYLPIDPKFPEDRVAHLLQESGAELVLVLDEKHAPKCIYTLEVITQKTWREFNITPPNTTYRTTDLAYVLFTSGSTGKPKGVTISHGSLANRLVGDAAYYQHHSQLKSLLLANMTFDISVLEIFQPLVTGGAVVVPEHDLLLDYDYIRRIIKQKEVSFLVATPSYLQGLLLPNKPWEEVAGKSVNLIISGGESLNPGLVKQVFDKTGLYLQNHYGPTEITINATAHPTDEKYQDNIIGKPLPAVQLKVLNQLGQPCPVGVMGTLYVSGPILCNGYFKNPTLSEQFFVKLSDGNIWYNTGDLVKWTEEGTLAFYGRGDSQIKYNGIRIELEEIAKHIRSFSGVKNAHVLVREVDSLDYLCAYIEWETEDLDALKEFVASKLPSYMVPNKWIRVKHFPVTIGGKLAVKELPLPSTHDLVFEKPNNEIEIQIGEIWSKLLGHKQFGTTQSFFEIGGNSLKLANFAVMLFETFGKQVSIQDLFEKPSIKAIARALSMAETTENTIAPAPDLPHYPLSAAQQRMFLLQAINPTGVHYNMPLFIAVPTKEKVGELKIAIQQIIDRHEALRTSFHQKEDELYQVIHAQVALASKEISANNITDFANTFIQPFDLTKAGQMRMAYGKLDEQWVVALDTHHIISDGVSMEIMVNELTAIMDKTTLPSISLHYKDFAYWQQEFINSSTYKSHENYWLQKFNTLPNPLDLVTDYPRPANRTFEGNIVDMDIDATISEQIKGLAKTHDTTPYVVMLSAYMLFLHKMSHNQDLVVGTPVAGRNFPGLNQMLGMFVNTVAIRVKTGLSKSIADIIETVKQTIIEAIDHQTYAFEQLLDHLNIDRNLARNPLFDCFFNYQELLKTSDHEDITVLEPDYHVAKFDLTLECYEKEDHFSIRLVYNTGLFSKETGARFLRYFSNIVTNITENQHLLVGELNYLDELDFKQVWYDFNQTKVVYPAYPSLSELLQAGMQEPTSEQAVIGVNGETLSYAELSLQSENIAQQLMLKKINKGDRIAVLLDESITYLPVLKAIIDIGAVYVPVDKNYPETRQQHIISDSEAKYIISKQQEGIHATNILLISDLLQEPPSKVNLPVINPDDLAYIIYTSGSTGLPKGVMVSHANIINRLQYFADYFNFNHSSVLMQFASLAFDASIFELLSMLSVGGKLVLTNKELKANPDRLIAHIEKYGVTNVTFSPSYLRFLNGKTLPACLKQIISAGEAIDIKAIAPYTKNIQVYNGYGPTENTIASSYHLVDDKTQASIPIGGPVANSSMYLLDKNKRAVGIGVIGEIYTGGVGVTKGYWKKESLTAEKFITLKLNSEKVYRTGDLGVWTPNGEVIYKGRLDEQVQVRGIRVEIDAIANTIKQIAGVDDAAIIDYTDEDNNTNLAAFVVASETTIKNLSGALEQILPAHEVPTFFQAIDKLPLTPNGKVNTSTLKKALNIGSKTNYVVPKNETETNLISIWQQVLQVEKIGREDHFFQLGGQSLKAMQVLSKISEHWPVELSLKTVFEYPILWQLAEQIDMAPRLDEVGIPIAPKQDYYPLSPAQNRIFVLNQISGDNITYNMPNAIKLRGKLDVDKMEKAINQIIERHEILRTSFHLVEGETKQQIHENKPISIEQISYTGEETLPQLINSCIRPFNLSKGPLMRFFVSNISDQEYLFVYDMHHIIGDAGSMGVFGKEVIEAYVNDQVSFEPLAIQYKDFACWQIARQQKDAYKEKQAFWMQLFEGDIPQLDLPLDYQRPDLQSFEGKNYFTKINPALSPKIKTFCAKNNLTPSNFFLAIYQILLSKITGQEDLVVGIPVSGRTQEATFKLIGMFVNTLPLRNQPLGSKSMLAFAKEVQDGFVQAMNHQEVPFEEILQLVDPPRNLGRNPLFDTMYTFLTYEENTPIETGLTSDSIGFETNTSKFDLTIEIIEGKAHYEMLMQYATKLFKEDTIVQLANYFNIVLEAFLANENTLLSELKLRTINSPKHSKEACVTIQKFNSIGEKLRLKASQLPALEILSDKNKVLNYKEVNSLVETVAQNLIVLGIKKGDRVGLTTYRDYTLPIFIAGIMRSGAVYVPILDSLPESRKVLQLKQAEPTLYINDGQRIVLEGIKQMTGQQLFSDISTPVNLPNILPDDLAYMIFTSGTTGEPKAAQLCHQNLHTLMHMIETFNLQGKDKILAITPVSFDISLIELVCCLAGGVQTHVLDETNALDPKLLANHILRENVSMIQLTPSRLGLVYDTNPDAIKQLSFLVTGGESLPLHLFNMLQNLEKKTCVNIYGPTETCVWSTYKRITPSTSYNNIGVPLPDEKIFILDAYGNEQPDGLTGEICITGPSVCNGYWKKPNLTEKVFFNDKNLSDFTIYRTGDLGKVLPNGDICYQGRKDQQVKWNGYRIELAEINHNIEQHLNVGKALTLVHKQRNELVCYYTKVSDSDPTEIRTHAQQQLPSYMVPSTFVEVPEIPVTTNGKINTRKLLETEITVDHVNAQPLSEEEHAMAELWEEVGCAKPNNHTQRFFDVGGNSIRLIKLLNLLSEKYELEIPLPVAFSQAGLKEMARWLSMEENDLYDIESELIVYNKEAEKQLFLFPPAAAIGYAYSDLAHHLPDYQLLCFHFPTDANPMETLVKEIMHHATSKEIVLGGYSIGGNLAFELAKILPAHGIKVTGILYLDTFCRSNDTSEQDSKDMHLILGSVDQWLGEAYPQGLINGMAEKVKKRITNYFGTIGGKIDAGNVEATALFLAAENKIDVPGLSRENWKNLHTLYISKQAKGVHTQILKPDYAKHNAEVIRELLEEARHFNQF